MQPKPLPEHLTASPFDRAAAASAGISAERLRRADVQHPYRGVQVMHAPDSPYERCRADAVRLRPGQIFSRVTEAQLFGFPLSEAMEADTVLDVAAVMPADAPRAVGVRGHRPRVRPPVLMSRGLPVVEPPEAWCQIAGRLDHDRLVEAADHLLNFGRADASRSATAAAIDRRGRSDRTRLRDALAEARRGSRSPGETRARVLLMRAGIPEPALNRTVTESGVWLGTPDLSWAWARVGLEYEGDDHSRKRRQYRADVVRYADSADAGWMIHRVISDDLVDYRADLLVDRAVGASPDSARSSRRPPTTDPTRTASRILGATLAGPCEGGPPVGGGAGAPGGGCAAPRGSATMNA